MSERPAAAKGLRIERLSRPGDSRYLFVPMDHTVSDGPITTARDFDALVAAVADGGADAVVVHKGRVRFVRPERFRDVALVIHLSASTAQAPDADAKVLVGAVEDAVRLGADAVSVHVNIGSASEARQLGDLGSVATACESWGMPLLAMLYPRGPRVSDPHDPALLAHAVAVGADLGADLVKTTTAHDWPEMADVIASSPVPVLVAGGPAQGSLAEFARDAMLAGCAGLAVGRRVFEHPDPRAATATLASHVHPGAPTTAHLSPALAGMS